MFTVGKGKAGIGAAICSAIKSRRVTEFYYHGGFRSVEPFCLGVIMPSQADNESLLCYQVGGYSEYGNTVGWKLYRASEISDLEITHEEFSGDRAGYDPDNPKVTTIYCRVTKGTGGEVRAEEPVVPVPKIERKIPRYEIPRKQTIVFLTHNELMRRFRLTHPIPLPELYTNVFARLCI